MRLFIGIRPDKAAVTALHETARRLKSAAPGRYADPSLYHITLAFVGEAESARVPAIRAAMERAANGFPPFSATLGAVGAFGPILWRGVVDAPALNLLSARVRAALDDASIPYDPKPFRAHITLARDSQLPAAVPPCPEATFLVCALHLYESVRHDGRLQYRSLTEVPIG